MGRIATSPAWQAYTAAELGFLRRYEWAVQPDGNGYVAVLVDRTPELDGSKGGKRCGHVHRKWMRATDCGEEFWSRESDAAADAAYRDALSVAPAGAMF